MMSAPWQPGANWPFRCSYAWAPGNIRPVDMDSFRAWAYRAWAWVSGDVFWLAKFKPEVLRQKYEYWRATNA